MKVLKAFLFRAYPSEPQWPFLRQTGGCVRLLKNLAREQRASFGRKGRYFSYEGQAAELKALKAEAPFLREVPHHCLQAALRDVHGSFNRFFAGLSGYPKPRKKSDDSFRFPDPKQFRFEPDSSRKWALLRLPKMGKRKGDYGPLRIRLHRPLSGKPRSITVSFEGDHCYVSVLCLTEMAVPLRPLGAAIGIDLGVCVPIMRSDGVMPRVPLPTPRQDERKRRLQQALSLRKRGSRNRSKARRALARHEAACARRRRDALHRATADLAKHHARVWIEDLRVRAMTASAAGTIDQPGRQVAQKSGLNRAILSVGWGLFRRQLDYKCPWYGSEVRVRNPARTSQTCSHCWHWNPVSRISRDVFHCEKCGHRQHADWNAARVVLGRDDTTPENTGSGSACGALCVSTATKQEVVSVMAQGFGMEAGSSGLQAGV